MNNKSRGLPKEVVKGTSMAHVSTNEASLVFSYLALRKAIGILGMALPFVVSLGAGVFFHTTIQDSISSYYHTGMRDVFVGILFAIGFFLLSYKGYERADDIAGDLGCIFAVGTALFPTAHLEDATGVSHLVGYIHLTCAALFFLTLIYFSLFLFTKTGADNAPSRKKQQRNKVYKACGYAMGICLLLIAIYYLLPDEIASHIAGYDPVYWFEALAILAFGISWFTKGEGILKDED